MIEAPCEADGFRLAPAVSEPRGEWAPPSLQEPARAPLYEAATPYAGFWRRLAACVIDRLALFIPVALIYGAICWRCFTPDFFEGGQFAWSALTSRLIAGSLAALVAEWLYFAYMESSARQATFGKAAMGIMVTDGYGQRISLGRASGRHFAKYISGLTLGIGYLMAGLTHRKQALHDALSDCLVVMRK